MNMYVYGWVAGRFRWVGFVCVGLVWLSVELNNFAKEGRQYCYETDEFPNPSKN